MIVEGVGKLECDAAGAGSRTRIAWLADSRTASVAGAVLAVVCLAVAIDELGAKEIDLAVQNAPLMRDRSRFGRELTDPV